MKVRVQVPATSANFGSGFDCLGAALDLYNLIEMEEAEGCRIELCDAAAVPTDETNLIYTTARDFYARCGRPFSGLHGRLFQAATRAARPAEVRMSARLHLHIRASAHLRFWAVMSDRVFRESQGGTLLYWYHEGQLPAGTGCLYGQGLCPFLLCQP